MATLSMEAWLKQNGIDPNNPEQTSQIKSLGVNGVATPVAPVAKKAAGSETLSDIKGIGSSIKANFQKNQEKAKETVADYKSGKQSLGSSILQGVGQAANVIGGSVADTAIGVGKALLPQKAEDAIGHGVADVAHTIQNDQGAQKVSSAYKTWAEKHPEASKDLGAVVDIASIIPAGEAVGAAGEGIAKGAGAIADVAETGAKAVAKGTGIVKTTIADTAENTMKRISSPTVSDATRVSLNPVVALKGTGQDIKVSVGGKIKDLSKITPQDVEKMQFSTEKNIENFTKQAEIYKNNRNPLNDPTEIVGNRTDKALDFAKKKQQSIGAKMGEIEDKYSKDILPVSDKTLDIYANLTKLSDNSTYGVKSTNSDIVKTLIDNFDTLEKKGATIAERTDFVRKWQTYIEDQKDNFGNFTENKYANSQIEKAVNAIKNETVDAVSSKDKIYRDLRKQYAEHANLQKIGNDLLGKDGALGDRIKGGATVKRAIKSNSDAGARQFLVKLKELTGYDALKEADLALTAMENVGDFQGLSLLEVLKQGKTGIMNKVGETIQNKLVGNNTKRVKAYIKK